MMANKGALSGVPNGDGCAGTSAQRIIRVIVTTDIARTAYCR